MNEAGHPAYYFLVANFFIQKQNIAGETIEELKTELCLYWTGNYYPSGFIGNLFCFSAISVTSSSCGELLLT